MTDPNKDEILAMAREAGCAWLHEPLAQRFAALCRADLVAEVERLKKMSVANIMVRIVPGYDGGGEEIYAKSVEEVNAVMSDLSQRLDDVETDRDDWKARALKAEQAAPNTELVTLVERCAKVMKAAADQTQDSVVANALYAQAEIAGKTVLSIAATPPQPAAQEPVAFPMESAPRDSTLVRLLVNFEANSLEDSPDPVWTIGANCFDNDGIDEWKFAGWDWSQDCFAEGAGKPIGWLPMLSATPPSAVPVVRQMVEALERKLPGGKQTDDFESSRIGDYNQGWNDYRKAVKKMFKNINMNSSENSNPDAYLYSLEYGEKVVDTKVSIHQLNYPFGVAGADYLVRNDDGVSYVRQTKLYAALSRALAAGQKFIKENGK